MAITELRIAALSRLIDAAAEQESQVKSRAAMQLASGLEVDRATIELGRLQQHLRAAESDLSDERAACSNSTGRPCERFVSPEQASRYLDNWVDIDLESLLSRAKIANRPDIKALASAADAARHSQAFFRRQKIPDPTVRLGYVHDAFWVSGAQPNSLEVSLSLPVPMFDWGQAGVHSAGMEAEGYATERQSVLQTTTAIVPSLIERLKAQRERRRTLITELIPRAKAVLDDVVRAYDTKLLSMGDVIQARRALLELTLEEIDGLADAYAAVLGLRAQIALSENEGCTP
jgi:cobalt-zinc-cadmium efflux system outer membrane protein